MLISTIWAKEPGAENAWCVDAWDEFSVDDNQDGWLEAVEKAKRENKDVRVIVVKISYAAVDAAFVAPQVDGRVL